MVKNITIKRSTTISLKGRIHTPSFFNFENLPEDNRRRLNEILSEVILPQKDKGENENENT